MTLDNSKRVLTMATYVQTELSSSDIKSMDAAPVGTFSGFESGANGLMRVSKTVGSYLHFYKQHLQFEFDSEKRNYAKYPTPYV